MIMDLQCTTCHAELSEGEISRSMGGAGATFSLMCDEHRGGSVMSDDGLE